MYLVFQAYREVEDRRDAEERKRNEAQAIWRWYQLLSSILTRQRLNHYYANNEYSSPTSNSVPQRTSSNLLSPSPRHNAAMKSDKEPKPPKRLKKSVVDIQSSSMSETDHQHVFLRDDEVFDDENSVKTKWCHCGFSVQVEEM